MSRAGAWVSKLRTALVADGRGVLAFRGWYVMPGGYWKVSWFSRAQFYLGQRFVFWLKQNWKRWHQRYTVENKSWMIHDPWYIVVLSNKSGKADTNWYTPFEDYFQSTQFEKKNGSHTCSHTGRVRNFLDFLKVCFGQSPRRLGLGSRLVIESRNSPHRCCFETG